MLFGAISFPAMLSYWIHYLYVMFMANWPYITPVLEEEIPLSVLDYNYVAFLRKK